MDPFAHFLGGTNHMRRVAEALHSRRLPDGTVGYYVRVPRTDDCLCAAIATCLQVRLDEVPDPRIDERLAAGVTADEIDRDAREELDLWLAARGLRMVVHKLVPVARKRWIGVVPLKGDFMDHCLVMSHDRVLFDPTTDLNAAFGGARVRVFGARDVQYGFSFRAV